MDWNGFFKSLREEGVAEITLKFDGRQVMPARQVEKEIKVTAATPSQFETIETDPVNVVSDTSDLKNQVEKRTATSRANLLRKREELRKEHPNFYSADELAAETGLSNTYVYRLCREASVPFKRIQRVKFFDVEQLWINRAHHEEDVLEHDGHRKGPTKLILSALEKLIK